MFHTPAHPGAKVTDRVIRKRYVWPGMHRDITNWCKACQDCQQYKVTRHNHLVLAQFVAPDGRFRHVHMDIVGPLPESDRYRYCLTMIDRFSRWPEAVPLKDIGALTVCRAFVDCWISRYGTPETLTTDQGSQFETQLFTALLQLTGCKRIRTTTYHPAANGMIERWHRSFKTAIMCYVDHNWSRFLSTVLLGLKSSVMDIGLSPAEFLYGTTLRIPGEFVLPEDFNPDPEIFLEEFREHMRLIKAVPVGHYYKKRAFLHKSLERPYTGPHRIIKRTSDRVFEINIDGSSRHVSVENIKPAHFLREDICNSSSRKISSETVNDLNRETSTDVNKETLSNVTPAIKTYSRKKKVQFKL